MDSVSTSAPQLSEMSPYDPKYLPAKILLSANESPYDLPDEVRTCIKERLGTLKLNRYPAPLANELRDEIAKANNLSREEVLVGNGGDELLFNLSLAWGGSGRTFLNMPPSFSVYETNARLTQTQVRNIPRTDTFAIDEEAVMNCIVTESINGIIVASPNNPSGNLADYHFLEKLLAATDALVLVDEAYVEFSQQSLLPLLKKHKNLILLRTFSKAYRLAGLRLGYVLADKEVITELIKVRQPYSSDAVSQMIGCCALRYRESFQSGIAKTIKERSFVYERLQELPGVKAYPSEANYILFKVDEAPVIWEELYKRGVLIRDFSETPLLTNCLRVSIGSTEENREFLNALEQILQERSAV